MIILKSKQRTKITMKRVLLVSMTALSLLALGACAKKPEPVEQDVSTQRQNAEYNAKIHFPAKIGALKSSLVCNGFDSNNDGKTTCSANVTVQDVDRPVPQELNCSLKKDGGCWDEFQDKNKAAIQRAIAAENRAAAKTKPVEKPTQDNQ
jgi:hypothetical protein